MTKWKLWLAALPTVALGLSAAPALPQDAQTEALLKTPSIPGQNLNGMHVYIRGGLKTHFRGQHDYPQFIADWSKILTEHGAVVDGSLHAPTAAELEGVDVLVIYKGDAGYMTPVEKAALDAFVKRGGGIVSVHDALCGPDPEQFATYVGGAKKHGEINFTLDAPIPYTIVDADHPIMKGMSGLTLFDEAFYKMTWSKEADIHVLATTVIADTPVAKRAGFAGQVVPQIWTYEHTVPGGKPARAFAWMQGHLYENTLNYQIENMLLRAIAWAGHRPAEELLDYDGAAPGPAFMSKRRLQAATAAGNRDHGKPSLPIAESRGGTLPKLSKEASQPRGARFRSSTFAAGTDQKSSARPVRHGRSLEVSLSNPDDARRVHLETPGFGIRN